MKKLIKKEVEEVKKFIIVNDLSQVFSGLKGGYPYFSDDWESAKPLSNERQFEMVKRGTIHKLEMLFI